MRTRGFRLLTLLLTLGLVTVALPRVAFARGHDEVLLAARLRGANEIPTPGGPAVGDPDGRGRAIVRLKGTQVCFALSWNRIGAPVAAHIHRGAADENGPVVVGFFMATLPDTLRAVAGCVTTDAATAGQIRQNPAGFYVNIHTADFPDGAVRGQLRVA